jgi:hypothetical protein
MTNLKFTGKHSVAVSNDDLKNTVKEVEPVNIRKEQPLNTNIYQSEKLSENVKEKLSDYTGTQETLKDKIEEADKLGDKIFKGQIENNYWHK